MRVLVLGATGMLGHQLCETLCNDFEVVGTHRPAALPYALSYLSPKVKFLAGIDADCPETVRAAIKDVKPDVILNSIGIVKQLPLSSNAIPSIEINALLPHRLAQWSGEAGARLIHFSTDCVFDGQRGTPYTEDDAPNPSDLYGRSKLLGEISGPNALTFRTSIVGREIARGTSLMEWFLKQRGREVRGFANALYTGFTTLEMSRLVSFLISRKPDFAGVWNVASPPISKYDLLVLINRIYGLDTIVNRDETFFCDRRLDGSRFQRATGYAPPDWPTMISDMHRKDLEYGRWG